MKHLKKLLIVLAIVAMLVSSASIIAVANEGTDYTGSLDAAQELLNKVPDTGVDARAEAIKAVYNYLVASPVDPSTEGYDAFASEYDDVVMSVLWAYYSEAMGKTTAEDKSGYLAKAYIHKSAVKMIDEERAYTIPGGSETITYSALVKKINEGSLEISEQFVAELFKLATDPSASGSYFDYLAAQSALSDYFMNTFEIAYKPSSSDVYTGSISAVNAILGRITASSSIDLKASTLKDVYTYLVKTPVDPTTDEYEIFYSTYVEYINTFVNDIRDSVNSAASTSSKLSILTKYNAYFKTSPLSKSAVDAYNALVNEIKESYNSIGQDFNDEKWILDYEEIKLPDNYTGTVASLKDLIDAYLDAKNLVVDGSTVTDDSRYAQITAAMRDVYDYVVNNPIAPTEAEYEAVMAQYKAERDYVVELILNKVKNTTKIIDQCLAYKAAYDYLKQTPLSKAAVDAINAMRVDIANTASNAYNQLVAEDMKLEYVEPTPPVSTVNVEMLNSLLDRVEEAEDMDAKMVAQAALYKYTLSINIDESTEGYEEFLNRYNAARETFGAQLLNYIDTETDKVAAFAKIGGYLSETPFYTELVMSFNDKVNAYTAEGFEAERYLVESGYVKLFAILNKVDADGEDQANLDNMKVAYDYIKGYFFDLTDKAAYDEYVSLYAEKSGIVSNILSSSIKNASTPEVQVVNAVAARDYLRDYPLSENAVLAYTSAINDAVYNYNSAKIFIGKYEDIVINLDTLGDLINAFNAISEPDSEFIDNFNALYDFYTAMKFDPTDPVYLQLKDAYGAACKKFTDVLVGSVKSFTTIQEQQVAAQYLFDYITDRPYSEYAVKEFNALINYIKGLDYVGFASQVETQCPAVVYTSAAGLVSDFTELLGYISQGTQESLVDAFNYIRTNNVDFAADGFADVLKQFNQLKVTVTDQFVNDILTAENDTARIQLLTLMHDFIIGDANYMSKRMVDEYNRVRLELVNVEGGLVDTHTKYLALYSSEVEKIHNHLISCPIDTTLVNYVAYADLTDNLDAIEYAELKGYILQLALEDDFTAQNTIMNKIDIYLNSNSINSAFNEYSALMGQIEERFNSYVTEVLDRVDSLGTKEEKVELLTSLKAFVESAPYANTVALFNAKVQEVDASIGTVDQYKGSVDALQALIDAVTDITADNYKEKMNLVVKAYSYYLLNPIDPSDAGYTEAKAELDNLVSQVITLLSNAVKDPETADLTAAFALYRAFLVDVPVSEAEYNNFNKLLDESGVSGVLPLTYISKSYTQLREVLAELYTDNSEAYLLEMYNLILVSRLDKTSYTYEALMLQIEDARAQINAATEAKKDELESNTNLTEYSWTGSQINVDFQDGKMPYTFHHSDQSTGNNTGTHWEIITELTGNKYLALIYGDRDSGGSLAKNGYIDIGVGDSTKGYVFEFDIMQNENLDWVTFSCTEWGLISNSRVSATFFRVGSGNVYDNTGAVIAENVVVPYKWTHIIMVYNPEPTKTVEIYVNYEFVAEYEYSAAEPFKLEFIRVQCGANEREVYLDNLTGYMGTSFRTVDRFETMTEDEQFVYYVNYFTRPTQDPINRNIAYSKAKLLVDNYRDKEEYKEYVEAFDNFDYVNDVLRPAQEQNYKTLKEMVDQLLLEPVTTENSAVKQTQLDNINSFILANSQYINQGSDDFTLLMEKVKETEQEIYKRANLVEFTSAINKFKRATTYASLTRHSEEAKIYFDLLELSNPLNYEHFKDDPAIVKLETELGMSVIDYYNSIESIIQPVLKYENSKRVVESMNYILNMDGYEATEEFWQANFDYINKYVVIVRNIVNNNLYDTEYEGVAEAVESFRLIDEYFYDLLQLNHIEKLNEQLDKYPLTDSYIAKLGICTYVEKYLENNDIDESLPQIQEIIRKLEIYKAEVKLHESEYAHILEQNTVFFIETVKKMDATEKYTELRALYEEAIKYYFAMNVDSDEAKAAIATFAQYEKELNLIKSSSESFIAAANKLSSAKTEQQLYRLLVECYQYVSNVTEEIDGVKAALEIYNTKLNEYETGVNTVNGEISQINDVVCSVRANSIAQIVLSAIKNLFSR